jgi:hypothetical protein
MAYLSHALGDGRPLLSLSLKEQFSFSSGFHSAPRHSHRRLSQRVEIPFVPWSRLP